MYTLMYDNVIIDIKVSFTVNNYKTNTCFLKSTVNVNDCMICIIALTGFDSTRIVKRCLAASVGTRYRGPRLMASNTFLH